MMQALSLFGLREMAMFVILLGGSGALPLTIQAGDQTLSTTLEKGILDWTLP